MIMGGKKRLCTQNLAVADMLDHRPCNAQTVKSGCASADLVQNQQTVNRGVSQNICHFIHLYHEGGLPAGQIIRRAHAGENTVYNSYIGLFCRDIGADLRHQDD